MAKLLTSNQISFSWHWAPVATGANTLPAEVVLFSSRTCSVLPLLHSWLCSLPCSGPQHSNTSVRWGWSGRWSRYDIWARDFCGFLSVALGCCNILHFPSHYYPYHYTILVTRFHLPAFPRGFHSFTFKVSHVFPLSCIIPRLCRLPEYNLKKEK
jgi:hypothetical protein